MKRRLSMSLWLLTCCALTAGCAPQPAPFVEPNNNEAPVDNDFTHPGDDFIAGVDPSTNTVSLPLDQFVLEGEEALAIEKANVALVNRCVVQQGEIEWPRVETDWDSARPFPDPYFGLFSARYAHELGYELPSFSNLAAVQEAEDAMSESWWATWSQCLDDVGQIPLSVIDSSWPRNVIDQGRFESLEEARNDERWRAAREAWAVCLREFDLQPSDNFSMRPFQPADVPERQVAISDVTCKERVGLVQQLVEIVAEYELEYVSENWEELVALGAEHRQNLQRASFVLESL